MAKRKLTFADISPLAQRVLETHAKRPDRLFYGTEALGSMFYTEALDELDRAYQKLAEKGLMAPTPATIMFFGSAKRLYRITEEGHRFVQELATWASPPSS